MMNALKKIFGQSVWNYIAAVVLAVAAGVFRFATLLEGVEPELGWYQTLTTVGLGEMSLRLVWYEILSLSGYVTFLLGALLMVAQWGALDMFSYAFSSKRGKYKDYTDYTQQKAEKRSKEGYLFMPFFVVGVVLVIVSYFLV